MGKSLKRMVFTIRNQFSSFVVTDDSRLKKELVEDMVLDVRALLAKEVFTANKSLGDEWYQDYTGIEVLSKKPEMPNGVKEEHPDIYSNLPVLQSDIGFRNIRYLGTVDGRKNFTRVSYSGFLSTNGRLVTSNEPFYTVTGHTVIYKNLPNIGIKYVRLIGVLYDPREAINFDEEKDFPMPDAQSHKCELIVIKQLSSTLGVQPDIVNDAADVNQGQPSGRR
jgi:hypothetical protein